MSFAFGAVWSTTVVRSIQFTIQLCSVFYCKVLHFFSQSANITELKVQKINRTQGIELEPYQSLLGKQKFNNILNF